MIFYISSIYMRAKNKILILPIFLLNDFILFLRKDSISHSLMAAISSDKESSPLIPLINGVLSFTLDKSILHYDKSIIHHDKSILHYDKSILHYDKSIPYPPLIKKHLLLIVPSIPLIRDFSPFPPMIMEYSSFSP